MRDAPEGPGLDTWNHLRGRVSRPLDRDLVDGQGVAEPDLLAQGIVPEASGGSHGAMDGSRSGRRLDVHAQAGSNGGPVGAGSYELKRDPTVGGARVQEQGVPRNVAGVGPAEADVHVLITVVVEVGKRNLVTLLKVAGARGGGDVVEAKTAVVPKHPVRNQGGQVGVARGEVEVEPSVVVEVAKGAAHRVADAAHPHLCRHVGEGAVPQVAIHARRAALAGPMQVVVRHVPHVVDPVAACEQVFPSVVVEVEEPRCEAEVGLGDACRNADVGEDPAGSLGGRGWGWDGCGGVVAEEDVGSCPNGEVKVGVAVVVVVGAGHALDEELEGEADVRRALGEGAVAIVAKQLAGLGVVRVRGFVAHEKVQVAVEVEVQPTAGLGGPRAKDAGLLGHVREGAMALVAQQGARDATCLAQPCAARDPQVEPAIVVVVRRIHLQPAEQPDQARLRRTFHKRAVAVVVVEPKLPVQPPGRSHDVEQSVVVEVVACDPSGEVEEIQAGFGRHVGKAGHGVLGGERVRRDEPVLGDLVRVFAQGHVGDVEQPQGARVGGVFPEDLREDLDGAARSAANMVPRRLGKREQAGLGMRLADAILLLAESKERHRPRQAEVSQGPGRQGTTAARHDAVHVEVEVEGLVRPTCLHGLAREIEADPQWIVGSGGGGKGGSEGFSGLVVEENRGAWDAVAVDFGEALGHADRAGMALAGREAGPRRRRVADGVQLIGPRYVHRPDAGGYEAGSCAETQGPRQEPRPVPYIGRQLV